MHLDLINRQNNQESKLQLKDEHNSVLKGVNSEGNVIELKRELTE